MGAPLQFFKEIIAILIQSGTDVFLKSDVSSRPKLSIVHIILYIEFLLIIINVIYLYIEQHFGFSTVCIVNCQLN